MTYITTGELASRLPQGGGILTTGELDGIINDHIARAEAENPTETAYSRQAVAMAARADALEQILLGNGATEAPIVTDLRREASTLFDKHDAMGEAPGEAGAYKASLVSNAIPTGLFRNENFFPRGIVSPGGYKPENPWLPYP